MGETEAMADAPPADVAVIIPAWRAEAVIGRAISSALAQQGVAVRVVVVDDCSPDDTLAAARAAAAGDPRVVALRQAQNGGPAAARNRALAAAPDAPWAAPLDSDDFMEPGRLASLLALAQAHEADFVADDMYKVPETDVDGPRKRLWSADEIGLLSISFVDFVYGNLTERHGGRGELGFVKPLMRRAFLDAHDIRYAEDMRLGEDYELYARALLRDARFLMTDPQGYVAVVRPDSLSGSHGERELRALVAADRRLLNDPTLTAEGRAALKRHYIETHQRWSWLRLIDAVKARNPVEAARCFASPLPVVGALIGNLAEQAQLRLGRRLRGETRSKSDA